MDWKKTDTENFDEYDSNQSYLVHCISGQPNTKINCKKQRTNSLSLKVHHEVTLPVTWTTEKDELVCIFENKFQCLFLKKRQIYDPRCHIDKTYYQMANKRQRLSMFLKPCTKEIKRWRRTFYADNARSMAALWNKLIREQRTWEMSLLAPSSHCLYNRQPHKKQPYLFWSRYMERTRINNTFRCTHGTRAATTARLLP